VKKGRLTWRYRNTRIVGGKDPKNPARNRAPIGLTSLVKDLRNIMEPTGIRRQNPNAKRKIEMESLIEAMKPPRKQEPSGLICPLAEDSTAKTRMKKILERTKRKKIRTPLATRRAKIQRSTLKTRRNTHAQRIYLLG
jgi:hypothetical protein